MNHFIRMLLKATTTILMYFSIAATSTASSVLATKLEAAIEKNEYKKITSVYVQHHGNKIYEQYFNEATPNTLHDIRSASKSFTSILFGIAKDKKLFSSVEEKVLPIFTDYLPVMYANKAKENMTFEQLLTMSSPLECDDWTQFSAGNEERMYLRKDWTRFVLDLPERGTPPWEPEASKQPYGRDYAYCTAGTYLIGAAIERRSKSSLSQFAEKNLFKPLNIEKSTWSVSPTGVVSGGGGVRLTTEDLIKVGQLMLNKGDWYGTQVVSKDWVENSLQPKAMAFPEKQFEYGYLWWIMPSEVQGKTYTVFAATGNGGNYLVFIPELNFTAVVTSTAFNTRYMHDQTQEIINKYLIPMVL